MKILVTGGTGFVGTQFLMKICGEHDVVLVGRDKERAEEIVCPMPLGFIDSQDGNRDEEIKKFNPQMVLHMATFLTSKERTDENIKRFIDSNILFGTQILNALVSTDVEYFVNVGTCSEYANNSVAPKSSDLYAATKTAFRSIIGFYQDLVGFKQIHVIPYSIYGVYPSKNMIDYLLGSLEAETPIPMTKGEQQLDFIHIDDITEFFNLLINQPQLIKEKSTDFFLGTGVSTSIRELSALIEEISGKQAKVSWGELAYRECASMKNIAPKKENPLGWKPQITIKEGVSKLFDNYSGFTNNRR